MGKTWDGWASPASFQRWCTAWGREALRVLKPGGHIVSFGGTRTHHRMAAGLEDAGFEIRDMCAWLFGAGFPKSLDVSKAIDKAAGAERERVKRPKSGDTRPANYVRNGIAHGVQKHHTELERYDADGYYTAPSNDPATPDAERWQGFGTALKPAFEPVVLARKPLSERNVAANVLRWGTGALNIDGCRIGTDDDLNGGAYSEGERGDNPVAISAKKRLTGEYVQPSGRWPANVTLDTEAAAALDEMSGELHSQDPATRRHRPGPGSALFGSGDKVDGEWYGDRGGASRFFYTAKAASAERNRGVAEYGPDVVPARGPVMSERCVNCGKGRMDGRREGSCCDQPEYEAAAPRGNVRNSHPTVKPVDLMQWLCRLVCPPGGVVLDPFTGSGSTGIAALREGFDFIGIERELEYIDIARARIQGDAPMFNVPSEVVA